MPATRVTSGSPESPVCRRRLRRAAFSLALVLAGAACGGGGDGGTTAPPGGGSFAIAASGSTLSVQQNASGTLTIMVTRTGGFAGAVSLTASGLPSGVTGSFSPSQVPDGQASSTLTLTAISAAAVGVSTVTITGSSAGQASKTVTVQLTITATPVQNGPFSLSISASSFLLMPNSMLFKSPVITITRNAGFTGSVAFTVSGLPATLFAGFTPSATTGNTTTVVPLNLGAPNGTYTATITGTAAGQGSQSVTLQLVVAPTSTGSIKWKFCSGSLPRFFFAVKDGSGPWTRLVPAADTSYSFNIASGAGSIAEVVLDSGGYRTSVHSYTSQEMAARAASQCQLVQNVTTRTANGTFGGVTGFRTSQVGMGWWFGSANGNGSFSLLNLPPGPLDVVAVRNGDIVNVSAIPVDAMIIRRGVNPASGAQLPVLNFTGGEAFAPTVSNWTIGNAGTDQYSVSQLFATAGGSTGIFTAIPMVDGPNVPRAVYGVPLAQTIAGDLHQVIITANTTGPTPGSVLRASRQIVTYARTIADRNISFGPAMPAPTVSVITGGPGGRVRVQGSLPTEYNTGVAFDITQTTTAKFATVTATRAFLGAGSNYDIQIPDLSGAIGWDTDFQLVPGIATNWWVSGGGPVLDFFDARYLFNSTRSRWTGAQTGIVAPADGATYLMARTVGVMTP